MYVLAADARSSCGAAAPAARCSVNSWDPNVNAGHVLSPSVFPIGLGYCFGVTGTAWLFARHVARIFVAAKTNKSRMA
jgi:hypothetical protein